MKRAQMTTTRRKRNRQSAKKAGASFERTPVKCEECGAIRYLLHPKLAGRMCRKCAAAIGTTQAAKVNTQDPETRFMRFVRKRENGCWEWVGTLQKNGYSTFSFQGKVLRGHRWSYEHFRGPIPTGLQIDHLCSNRRCVNPSHLEPVTARENSRRAMRTHCVNGHEFSTNNIYMHNGKRYCRECRRQRNQNRYRKNRHAKK